MNITPLRGLNLRGTHAPANVPVEVDDKLGKELIDLGVARRTPPDKVAAPSPAKQDEPRQSSEGATAGPVVETAAAAPAPETATAPAAVPAKPKKLKA